MYRFFEHTADAGLEVEAPDLDTLFRDAAEGLFAVMVQRSPTAETGRVLEFDIEGERYDFLLFDWLNELLYTFESQRLLLSGFEVRVERSGLRARVRAEPLDPAEHRLLHEVKAITYHELKVEKTERGWLARVIMDL